MYFVETPSLFYLRLGVEETHCNRNAMIGRSHEEQGAGVVYNGNGCTAGNIVYIYSMSS